LSNFECSKWRYGVCQKDVQLCQPFTKFLHDQISHQSDSTMLMGGIVKERGARDNLNRSATAFFQKKMSLNPDDDANVDQEKIIQTLRDENKDLKKQIQELTRRLASHEMSSSGASAGDPGRFVFDPEEAIAAGGPGGVPGEVPGFLFQAPGAPADRSFATEGTHVGRKSLPFGRRNSKQHQGRMTYLLKKLEMGTSQAWTQDAIADLHTYCTSDPEFFRKAVVVYTGNSDMIQDMDVFIAMLQSHNS